MRLRIIRTAEDGNVTRGSLYIGDTLYASTIEPGPLWKKGPIPCGTYTLEVTWSPKFKRLMPLISGVPGFTGIRIHGGTSERHTEGCICIPASKVPHLTYLIKNEQENLHRCDVVISRAASGFVSKLL